MSHKEIAELREEIHKKLLQINEEVRNNYNHENPEIQNELNSLIETNTKEIKKEIEEIIKKYEEKKNDNVLMYLKNECIEHYKVQIDYVIQEYLKKHKGSKEKGQILEHLNSVYNNDLKTKLEKLVTKNNPNWCPICDSDWCDTGCTYFPYFKRGWD